MGRSYFTKFLFSVAAMAMTSALASQSDIDNGTTTLIKVADGIYAVSPNFAGANGALILNESGHIVVDSHGTPASARALIDAVREISDEPIRYVVNTHWHVDHHSGNSAYEESYGDDVIFISHDETRKEIPTLGAEQFRQVAPYRSAALEAATDTLAEKMDAHGKPLTAPQTAAIEAFAEEQRVFAAQQDYRYTLANLTYSESLTLHGVPNTTEVFFLGSAHTKTDSIVYVRDQEVLIVGDLLTQPILWSWSSYPSSYVLTLKALEQLPVKKIIIGHGGPVLEGKNYLSMVRQFLEATVAHSMRSRSAGLSEEEAISSAANSDIETFRRKFVAAEENAMFDQMVAWTITRAFAEMSE
jgi:cyclase